MNFYKNVIEHKGKLLIRGVLNGKDYKDKIDFGPTLYALSQQKSEFKNLQGQYLKPITFNDIKSARQFRKDYAHNRHYLVLNVITINILVRIIQTQ